jgi:hypothetical protein
MHPTGNLLGLTNIISDVPNEFFLYHNYPNPFNPVTRIRFDIPHVGAQYTRLRNGQVEPVHVKVFDILGREIATLVNEILQPGTYEVEWMEVISPAEFIITGYYHKISMKQKK